MKSFYCFKVWINIYLSINISLINIGLYLENSLFHLLYFYHINYKQVIDYFTLRSY